MDDISTSKRKKIKHGETGLTKKVKSHKKKKDKKILQNEDDSTPVDGDAPKLEEVQIKTNKKTETEFKNTPASSKPKKIIFVDDEPHVVSDTNTSIGTVIANKKRKKHLNEDEEEVKDEDIDKFCDEIDDQDNEQYEDWIKQIEATLHPKKKK